MNNKLLPIGIILLVVGMVALGVYLSKGREPAVQVLGEGIQATDRTKGNAKSKVELIEYGDMQCPACASFEPMVNRLLAERPELLHFAYRHLPLKSIHKNAEAGSYAVEAAGQQGKFWEMKTMVYAKQSEWSAMPDPSPKFQEYALALGLDMDRFLSAYHSSDVKAKVAADALTAETAGFQSTPTFALNGKKIANPKSYDELIQLLESEQPAGQPAQ